MTTDDAIEGNSLDRLRDAATEARRGLARVVT